MYTRRHSEWRVAVYRNTVNTIDTILQPAQCTTALHTFIKSRKRQTFSIGSDGRFEPSIYLFIHLIFSSSLQTTYVFPKHMIDILPQYTHSAAQQCYCCNMETHADTIKEEHSILDHSMYTS